MSRRRFGLQPNSAHALLVLLVVLVTTAGAQDAEAQDIDPLFDLATRGDKKYGDKCFITNECGFWGSVCDPTQRRCHCLPDLPATNQLDKCGKAARINESCSFHEQCEVNYDKTTCRDQRCICQHELSPVFKPGGTIECIALNEPPPSLRHIDPAMIGVLVGMALMFIIICVVLRLFSKARWRENRTIFNTPNPRLMNVSLLRDSKLLHGQERRGSRASVRAPSRQPSVASLRPHSPGAAQGGRRGSHGSSNASAASTRSNKSPTGPQSNHVYINPKMESVTVEVQEPKA